jgi:hypothetical protein
MRARMDICECWQDASGRLPVLLYVPYIGGQAEDFNVEQTRRPLTARTRVAHKEVEDRTGRTEWQALFSAPRIVAHALSG